MVFLSTFLKYRKMSIKIRIEKKLKRKTNPELVASIIMTKKKQAWNKVSHLLSRPARKMISVNLDQLDKNSEEGDNIVVPGKILGTGDITKKIKIIAFSFSKAAEKKLREKKCELASILDEVKKNPKSQGIKVVS